MAAGFDRRDGPLGHRRFVTAGLALFAGSTVLSAVGFGIGLVAMPIMLLVLDQRAAVVLLTTAGPCW